MFFFFTAITGDLFLLVFSVDNEGSFEEVLRLREQIIETKCHIGGQLTRNAPANTKKAPTPNPVPMVIAGNKCDKDMR